VDPEVRERNLKLRQLVESCREINDGNGLMIRRQSQRVDNTLRLLRGGRGDSVVYGPKGTPGQKTNVQTLLTSA
jgi:flagellar biosynthesis/type III secretory pathway chaperone